MFKYLKWLKIKRSDYEKYLKKYFNQILKVTQHLISNIQMAQSNFFFGDIVKSSKVLTSHISFSR